MSESISELLSASESSEEDFGAGAGTGAGAGAAFAATLRTLKRCAVIAFASDLATVLVFIAPLSTGQYALVAEVRAAQASFRGGGSSGWDSDTCVVVVVPTTGIVVCVACVCA